MKLWNWARLLSTDSHSAIGYWRGRSWLISPRSFNELLDDQCSSNSVTIRSFVLWRQKISWIKALVHASTVSAPLICLNLNLNGLKRLYLGTIFPHTLQTRYFRRFSSDALNKIRTAENEDKPRLHNHLAFFPYIGDKTTQPLRSFKRKFRRCLANSNIEIKVRKKTTKLCFYTNNKDEVPLLNIHMLFTNSVALVANQRTSAKRTELFSSESMNTLSLIKRAQLTNTCERVII